MRLKQLKEKVDELINAGYEDSEIFFLSKPTEEPQIVENAELLLDEQGGLGDVLLLR